MWQIPAAVIERLGPWLVGLAKTSPGLLDRIWAFLKSQGVNIEHSISSLIAWAKKEPWNAALLFGFLAQAGHAVADLFLPSDKADPNVRATAAALDSSHPALAGTGVLERAMSELKTIEAQGTRSNLLGSPEGRAEAAAIVGWATRFFGSRVGAKKAHMYLKAYMNMSPEDIEEAYNLGLERSGF